MGAQSSCALLYCLGIVPDGMLDASTGNILSCWLTSDLEVCGLPMIEGTRACYFHMEIAVMSDSIKHSVTVPAGWHQARRYG